VHLIEAAREGIGWINVAENRDKYCTLVNMVINFVFLKIPGTSFLIEAILASQQGL
jgi:hypothetical protein